MEFSAGESVIFEGRPSWRSILGFYFLGLLAVAAAATIGYLASGGGIAAAAGGGVLVVVLIWGWLKRLVTRYTITNRRIRIRRGILSRNIEETRLERVQDVKVHQNVGQRLLGIGSVDFGTAAEAGAGFRFEGVADPDGIARRVDEVIHAEGAPPLAPEPPPLAPEPPPPR